MKRLGIDTGGTFTDFALIDEDTGAIDVYKYPTSNDDPTRHIIEGAGRFLTDTGTPWSQLSQVVYATTHATNTVLERKGRKTALITTEGFRDILLIQRQDRYDLYDLFIEKPKALLRRSEIFEVPERMSATGEVLRPLDEAAVRRLAGHLRTAGVQVVAVCLINSYTNREHELAIGKILAEEAPDLLVTLSCDVSPQIREYERTSTTVMNAYVMPATSDHIASMGEALKGLGFGGQLFVMNSNGGLSPARVVEQLPVRIIESGPAAGALMAANYGRDAGTGNLVAFDMGGTTAKVSVIEQGAPRITDEFEVDRVRMLPRSGLPITVPSVDLIEIGAGGGSIASVKDGLITVGPESASAYPGPVCYGRGGERATVTDCDLVLGYLNPENFLGGRMRLDVAAAREAIRTQLSIPLGLTVEQAAWGIHEVVNANMERAARAVSVERGYDPRDFTFVAFGGQGPVHGGRVARGLGIRRALYPAAAGVTSALGLLTSDLKFDLTRTHVTDVAGGMSAGATLFRELEESIDRMTGDVRTFAGMVRHVERYVEMRYVGQGYEVRIPVTDALCGDGFAGVEERFHAAYAALYGDWQRRSVEIVTWCVVVRYAVPRVKMAPFPTSGDLASSRRGSRPVYFPETGWVETPVYDRMALFAGADFTGPAVVEERESTTVILPGDRCVVGPLGNLLVDYPEEVAG